MWCDVYVRIFLLLEEGITKDKIETRVTKLHFTLVNSHVRICWYALLLTERATDNAASAGNLALHLEICDAINDTDSG